MGEINLIPGQEVRGRRRADQRSEESVEYTQPEEQKIPAPSLIPVASKPPKESWWQRRQKRKAQRKAQKEAEQAALAAKRLAQAQAQAKAQAVKVPAPVVTPHTGSSNSGAVNSGVSHSTASRRVAADTTPPPPRPLAVDVNLLPHGGSASLPQRTTTRRPSTPQRLPDRASTPLHVQAEPDFLSDAGFRSNSTRALPASEAYSIRRTKHPSQSASVKHSKEALKPKHPTHHEPTEKPVELLDVNLIPKEFEQAERPKHALIELVWYGLTAVLIVGAVYGGLQWWEFNLTQRSSELQQQITLLDAEISDYASERAEASELQTTLQALGTILSQHVTYQQFFSFLEENTLPSVYYKSMNIDSRTGQLTATAVTSDFDQLRAQEAVFQSNPFVQDVVITSATRSVPTTPTEGEVVVVENAVYPLLFNLSLSLDTSLFHP